MNFSTLEDQLNIGTNDDALFIRDSTGGFKEATLADIYNYMKKYTPSNIFKQEDKYYYFWTILFLLFIFVIIYYTR